jgi:hypothetical protein
MSSEGVIETFNFLSGNFKDMLSLNDKISLLSYLAVDLTNMTS